VIRARRGIIACVVAAFALRAGFALVYWTDQPLTHDEREYLALAVGGLVQYAGGGRRRLGAAGELLDEPAGDAGSEQRLPVGHHPDRGQQVGRGRVLEQEPARPDP